MAIPQDQLLIAEVGLAAFAGRVPEDIRDKVQIRFRRDRQSLILFEWRPRMFEPSEWAESPVAKLTYVQTTGKWRLYWRNRNQKWKTYPRIPESDNIEVLLREIDQDPWNLFWG